MRRKSWDKGQSTLEYFIIFAVIACVVIPLWSGSSFSGIQDSGKGFFTACVDRILKDSEAGEPAGPAEVTLIRNFPNPFDSHTRLGMVIKDNSCEITVIVRSSGGSEVDRVEYGEMAPCSYDTAPGHTSPGHCAAPIWYPPNNLASGTYSWSVEVSEGSFVSGTNSSNMSYIK